MHGLPPNFDSTTLVGLTLEMVCFNLNQVYLHFDNQVKIVVESILTYRPSPGLKTQELSSPVRQTNLMQLIGKKTTSVIGKPDGTLSLIFDDGGIVECLDSLSNYESYQIHSEGKTILV